MLVEKLTKVDVARRQIDEAIRMFFERRDTVSTHTVVSAAAQVLSDLGKGGFQGWTRNPGIVKPGRWSEWRNKITNFEVFFKHANHDPHATCEFHPEITPLFIIESVEMLRVLTGKFTWEGMIFSLWFSVKYPEILEECEFKKAITSQSVLAALDVNDFGMITGLLRIRSTLPQSAQDALLP